jgi:imidazolonepropionase-like amidohydrolase
VDVEKKRILPGQTVVVLDSFIRYAGRGRAYKLPDGTQVLDGTGKYLVPGFVDAHVHFFQSGGLYTRPDVIDLRSYRPYAAEIRWTQEHMEGLLRRYLAAGITSVADVGATLNLLRLRDSMAALPFTPAVYMTGPLLTTWLPPEYKDLGKDAPFAEMKTEEDARRLVREQLPARPDFIKIWYIVLEQNTEEGARKLQPLVRAAIEEARRHGLRTAVHATEQVTARLAVEAGADFLVHGIDNEPVNDAFLHMLKERNVVVSPTLTVGGNYRKALGGNYRFTPEDLKHAHPVPLGSVRDLEHLPDTMLATRYQQMIRERSAAFDREDSLLRLNLQRMRRAGVRIAVGTDAGNIGTQHVGSYPQELRALKEAGFTPAELLEAATLNGARALGREKEWGTVAEGKRGNLVLLDGNPLEDLAQWNRIHRVIRNGTAWEPDSLILHTPEALAQEQLNAYNAHDLEAFLRPYAEDVEIYGYPDKLQLKGKQAMREAYAFLKRTPGLFCVLKNRIVQGNTVIDHEEVYGFGPKPVYAVAVYTIEGGLIRKVRFIQ